MYYTYGIEKTDQFKEFLAMTPEQFDKHMCKTYPDQFNQRKQSMRVTCMCWGFCIGKGWYYYLDELCGKLDAIRKITGIKVSFSQIKEKYGSGRFYHDIRYGRSVHYRVPSKNRIVNFLKIIYSIIVNINIKTINKLFYRMSKQKLDLWANVIDELIHNCESRVGHTCEETGEYIDKPIDTGGWIYALSEKAFLEAHPDRKEDLEEWEKYKEEKKKIKDAIAGLSDEATEELKKFLKIV